MLYKSTDSLLERQSQQPGYTRKSAKTVKDDGLDKENDNFLGTSSEWTTKD